MQPAEIAWSACVVALLVPTLGRSSLIGDEVHGFAGGYQPGAPNAFQPSTALVGDDVEFFYQQYQEPDAVLSHTISANIAGSTITIETRLEAGPGLPGCSCSIHSVGGDIRVIISDLNWIGETGGTIAAVGVVASSGNGPSLTSFDADSVEVGLAGMSYDAWNATPSPPVVQWITLHLEFDYEGGGSELYGVEGDTADAKLLSVEPATGASTEVGSVGIDPFGDGALAYDPAADLLYAVNGRGGDDNLYLIDPNTGVSRVLGNVGVDVTDPGLAFNPVERVLYLVTESTGSLYEIDPAVGPSATLLGSLDFGVVENCGLAFDPTENTIWGVSLDRFFKIDLDVGTVAQEVGVGNFGGLQLTGLARDPQSGLLYASDSRAASEELYVIDPTTAGPIPVPVGPIARPNVEGLAFRKAASTPPSIVPTGGKKLILIDKLASVGSTKVVYVSKDALAGITKGSATDSADISGEFSFFYTGENGSVFGAFTIPMGAGGNEAAGWTVNKPTVAKFVNSGSPSGPTGVKVAVVKPGKLLKVVGRSLGDTPGDLLGGGVPAGPIRTIFTVANGDAVVRHCSRFDPNDPAHAVDFRAIAGGTGRKLVAKQGGAAICP